MSVSFDHNLGNVWQSAGGLYNGMLQRPELAWLSPRDRCRAERLRQAKLLFGGAHREFYLEEKRSSFQFRPLTAKSSGEFYTPFNLLKMVSIKTSDLLFGEVPSITIGEQAAQVRLEQILDRSWMAATLASAAIEASWAGETFLEITLDGGNAYIAHIPADELYPVGAPGPDRQYAAYVRYATQTIGGDAGTKQTTLLMETRYTRGQITRSVSEIGDGIAGARVKGKTINIDEWPVKRADGSSLPGTEATGLSRNSIVYIPNEYQAASDYENLLDAQDAVNAKHTQIARVLAIHSDPKLRAPRAAADPNGNMPEGDVVFSDGPDDYGYLTWKAELAPAMEDRKFALLAFATLAEMPLSLLGVKDDATAESAAKMRLNAVNAIAKAQRKAAYWQAGIRLACSVAIEAETGAVPTDTISVSMRDGLPIDESERATTIATLRGASMISMKRGLEMQWLDRAEVEEELAEIQKETNQQMPGALLGDPENPGIDPGTTSNAA